MGKVISAKTEEEGKELKRVLDIYTRVLCDICGKECDIDNESIKTLRLQPYRGVAKIDICEQCSQELSEKWKNEEMENKELAKMVASIKNNNPDKK